MQGKAFVLVGNAGSYPEYMNDLSGDIKLVFIPPNTTSLIQQLDQGIIVQVKSLDPK